MLKFNDREDDDEDEDIKDVDSDKEAEDEEDDEDEGDEKEEEEAAEDDDKEEVAEEEEEEPKLTKSQLKRREKKEYQRRRREEEAARLAALEERVAAEQEEKQVLKEFISKLSERVDSRDMAEIDGRMQAADQRYRDAEAYIQKANAAITTAFETGDSATFGRIFAELDKAKEIKAQAVNEWNALKGIREKVAVKKEREPVEREVETETRPNIDARREASFRAEFVSKNTWLNLNDRRNPETVAALLLNQDVMNDGYKPDTKAFWDELGRRVREKMPHKYKTSAKKPPQLVGGRESSAPKGGSDNEGRLDPAFRKVLNERYGRDKNDSERKKAVAEYLKIVKEGR